MKKLTKTFGIAALVGAIFITQNATASHVPIKIQLIDAGWENFFGKQTTGYDAVTESWDRFIKENTEVVIVPRNYDVLISLSFQRLLDGRYNPLPKSNRTSHELAMFGWDKII